MKLSGHGLLLAIVSAVVASVIVVGFLTLGTPGQARKEELDRKRVEHLSQLADAIRFRWNDHKELPPASLEDFTVRRPLPADMRDPATKQPYGYRNLGDGKFELCATFDAEVKEADADVWRDWPHPAGPHCFSFDVKAERGPYGKP